MTDLQEEIENGIPRLFEAAFARFMLVSDALKLKASLFTIVDWQWVSPACCFTLDFQRFILTKFQRSNCITPHIGMLFF